MRVGIRLLPAGVFSGWATQNLRIGEPLDVMPPQGRFLVPLQPTSRRHWLFIAAGSGMEALGSALFVTACSAVGAPHLEQTSEPSLISATDMSQVVRLKYTE